MPKLNFFRKRSAKERSEILARLAASETLGMIGRSVDQSSATDRTRATQRLALLTGFTDPTALGEFLDTLLAWMRDSPLNINLNAGNFFATATTDAKYMTKFEKMRTAGAPVTLNAQGSPQGSTRDVAEQKIFGYDRKGIAGGALPATKGVAEAGDRIQAFGDMASTAFEGAIRPKYCTLNVWRVSDGSGAQWGKSFFVLADHLKATTSFVHSDSFDFAGGNMMIGPNATTGALGPIPSNNANASGAVATFHNMTRIIIHASDALLDSIADCATGATGPKQPFDAIQRKYGLSQTSYIEGHVHGELHFARDFSALKVSLTEVNGAPNPELVKANILNFGTKYKLPVTYY